MTEARIVIRIGEKKWLLGVSNRRVIPVVFRGDSAKLGRRGEQPFRPLRRIASCAEIILLSKLIISLTLMGVMSACTIRDDSTRANQLESLRILGVASEPADLMLGETAILSALVYEPTSEAVRYEWSWCLSRGGADDAYACNIEEADLQAAWQQVGMGAPLPAYDLGSETTASFELSIGREQAFALCELVTREEESREIALFTCLSGLGLHVQLRVSTDLAEVIALKSIPILESTDERNRNPALGSTITVFGNTGDVLEPGESLRAEGAYGLEVEVARTESETFTPKPEEGLPPPEAKQESLFMSWFVTTGNTHQEGAQKTAYHEGGDFEVLLFNYWKLPFDLEGNTAELFVVLRDERGGVSWRQHSFQVEEAE